MKKKMTDEDIIELLRAYIGVIWLTLYMMYLFS